MAHEYWGVNQGQHATDVVVQSSDPSKNVTLIVDLAQTMSREEVLLAMEMIRQIVIKGNWPPA